MAEIYIQRMNVQVDSIHKKDQKIIFKEIVEFNKKGYPLFVKDEKNQILFQVYGYNKDLETKLVNAVKTGTFLTVITKDYCLTKIF